MYYRKHQVLHVLWQHVLCLRAGNRGAGGSQQPNGRYAGACYA
jgi:hypothetical protein